MKKLNLDETWKLCLQMWKWIAKQKKNGSRELVAALKKEWLCRHKIDPEKVFATCFFCAYCVRSNADTCDSCPGRKVNKDFNCRTNKYHYCQEPKKFYKELVRLNKIRLAKKKK